MRAKTSTTVAATVLVLACSGRTDVQPVSFEFHRNQLVVPVYVNGKGPYTMIIDTGANPSAIDLATAMEAGVVVDTTRSGYARPWTCPPSRSDLAARFTAFWDTPVLRETR